MRISNSSPPRPEPAERWIKSHCQQCFNACGITVQVKDGKPVKIMGDVDDPTTLGHLCARVLSGVAKLYDPHRVKTPLIRTNPEKGRDTDPGWREATWDEALDLVAAKLRTVRNENPNKLICSFFPFEKFVQTFMWGVTFGRVNGSFSFSGISNQCANPSHFLGSITHGAWNEFPDLKHTSYMIQLGSEFGFGAHQSFVRFAREMAEARERGMKLVVAGALVVATYQGFAMSHSSAIALWSTAMMPFASLLYAITGGTALVFLLQGNDVAMNA